MKKMLMIVVLMVLAVSMVSATQFGVKAGLVMSKFTEDFEGVEPGVNTGLLFGGMIIGFQFLLDDHYRLEGRLFRSFDDIIDSEGSLGHASLKPAYFSIGFSFYF